MKNESYAARLERGFADAPADDDTISEYRAQCLANAKEIQALTTERDVLKADARRYQWIPVSERLPEYGFPVFVCEESKVLRAMWVPKHTIDDAGFEGDTDYDAETDTSYWPEGWYEWNEHEEIHWVLDAAPSHWMPLPNPPMEQP